MNHEQQRGDIRWKERRAEIISRDGNKCTSCGSTDRLQVHHRYYVSRRAPWNYPGFALFTLCIRCHAGIHGSQKKDGEWEQWEFLLDQIISPDAGCLGYEGDLADELLKLRVGGALPETLTRDLTVIIRDGALENAKLNE